MGLQSFPIFAPKSGLQTKTKPVFLPNDAWQQLDNAYAWRDRVLKREGLKLLGRLQRNLTSQSLGTTVAGPPNTITINDIFTTLSLEASGELVPGTLVITIGAPDAATFTDMGNGNFSVTGKGVAAGSYVNYVTGKIVLQMTSLTGGAAITANLGYYPVLPSMGIISRDLAGVNSQQTIWWDEVYAYIFSGTNFEEFIPGTTWASGDSDFFWGFNYRGAGDNNRLLFVTNFKNDTADPMRYTDGTTWTTFQPIIADNPPSAAQSVIFTAKLIVSYYGRLLLMNTYEGLTASGHGGAANFFNRCRFSQLGSPIASDAFRADQFGKGGFLDAPTNEAIIGAEFVRNTLIVEFENSTWQLRYVGEYGTPFIWERISSDLGSNSTFASILFDNYLLTIGDKAIINANSNTVTRIDLDIPDAVFNLQSANNGPLRIFGIRNYQKEIVYWNYVDSQTQLPVGTDVTFPNKVFLFNYRTGTWAIFRDNVTCFGTWQVSADITWSNNTITWDNNNITWDDSQSQSNFPAIVSGNQQGFISLYQEDYGLSGSYTIQEEPSLTITDIDLTVTPLVITSANHNLQDGEIIYITGMQFLDSVTFLPLPTNLNNNFYAVSIIDSDTFSISSWNFTTQQYDINFPFTPVTTALYIGGGLITLVPKLDATTKDINIYQTNSLQTKLSRLDFLMEPSSNAAVTVNLFINATPALSGNLLVGNKELSTVLDSPFYPPASDYAWFRFYATLAAQYFSINLTYDDNLMNTAETHIDPMVILAINAWTRPGGKNVF